MLCLELGSELGRLATTALHCPHSLPLSSSKIQQIIVLPIIVLRYELLSLMTAKTNTLYNLRRTYTAASIATTRISELRIAARRRANRTADNTADAPA